MHNCMQKQRSKKYQATTANNGFDIAVKHFLRKWIESNALAADTDSLEDFINNGALREFFKRTDEPFQALLTDKTIARHLCRTHHEVYFDPETKEPLLSPYETRIYNLAAHRQDFGIPYRFIPLSRQGNHGDRAQEHELPENKQDRDMDIGDLFATRRADVRVIDTMHRELQHVITARHKNVHVTKDIFMEDGLKGAVAITQIMHDAGQKKPQFFVLQHRYAMEPVGERHFGAALLIMDPENPKKPKRIIFFDTFALPGWLKEFGERVERVFDSEIREKIEIGSHLLQEDNKGSDPTKFDVNCSFYTRSIARALITLAQDHPHLLFSAPVDKIHEAMKSKMHDYYLPNNEQKPREEIQVTNLHKRWNIGRSVLLKLTEHAKGFVDNQQATWLQSARQRDKDRENGIGLDDDSITR